MLDGEPLEIDIVTYSSRAALPPTAELTQAFLQAIGVKANVRVGEYGASNDAIANGDADMFLQAWVMTPQGDPGAVLETLLKSDGGSNAGRYANSDLDKLLADGRLTFEQDKREAIYDKAQEIIASEAALIPVFHVSQVNVARPGLPGYAVHGNHHLVWRFSALLSSCLGHAGAPICVQPGVATASIGYGAGQCAES